MKYYHTLKKKEDLVEILKTGYLKSPVFVTKEGVAPYKGGWPYSLELDLKGFRLKKDPHPYALEGYYLIVNKRIPISRIKNLDDAVFELGPQKLEDVIEYGKRKGWV